MWSCLCMDFMSSSPGSSQPRRDKYLESHSAILWKQEDLGLPSVPLSIVLFPLLVFTASVLLNPQCSFLQPAQLLPSATCLTMQCRKAAVSRAATIKVAGEWLRCSPNQPAPSQVWPTLASSLCQRADLNVAPATKNYHKNRYSRPKTWAACCEKRKELMGVWRVVASTHLVETGRRCSLEGDFQRLAGMFTVCLGFNFHLIPGPRPERSGN